MIDSTLEYEQFDTPIFFSSSRMIVLYKPEKEKSYFFQMLFAAQAESSIFSIEFCRSSNNFDFWGQYSRSQVRA